MTYCLIKSLESQIEKVSFSKSNKINCLFKNQIVKSKSNKLNCVNENQACILFFLIILNLI